MASYAKPIADAVVAILDALSGTPTLVEFRKADVLHPTDLDGASNAIIVTIGDERLLERAFEGSVFKAYTVQISLYRKNLGDVETDLDTHPDLILRSKQALDLTSLSGVTVVQDVDLIENHAEWEPLEFRNGLEKSVFGLLVRTNEPRNG